MVNKQCGVLDNFLITARPSDLTFDRLLIWARVTNLPFNLLQPPWINQIAKQVQNLRKQDVDPNGFAISGALRARVWLDRG